MLNEKQNLINQILCLKLKYKIIKYNLTVIIIITVIIQKFEFIKIHKVTSKPQKMAEVLA